MHFLIYSIFLTSLMQAFLFDIALATNTCAHINSSASTPTETSPREMRDQVFQRIMDANTRFPKTNFVIILSVLEQFLRNPRNINAVSSPVTHEETLILARRLDKIHEAYGIPVATEGYETSRPIHQRIPLAEVRSLGDMFVKGLPRSLTRLLISLQPERSFAFEQSLSIGEVDFYGDLTHHYTTLSQSTSKEGKILRYLGPALRRILESKELNEASLHYRNTISQGRMAGPQGDRSRPLPKITITARDLSVIVMDQLKDELSHLKPNQSFFDNFSRYFLGG
ncbi:MAG: hypothetical protein AB7F59_01785 [Bdellovibrionales bacterium]